MITYDVHVLMGKENPEIKETIKCHDTGVNFRIFPEIAFKLSNWRKTIAPYTIPSGSIAILKVKKSDKTYVLTDGKVEQNSIFFKPHPQSFTAPGKASAEVNIYDKNMRRITTGTFYLDVSKECACDCKQESGSYVDILAEQIKAIYGAIDAAAAVASHLPIIGSNGNWWMWDVKTEQYFDSGMSSVGTQGEPGPQGPPGEIGPQGDPGTPGHTPEKGVDYFTPEDKAEIVNEVLAAIPDGNERSY